MIELDPSGQNGDVYWAAQHRLIFSTPPKASELRQWAIQKGYELQKNENGIEQWGNRTGWKLKIKAPSQHPNIHPDSKKYRYFAKDESGNYFDPATGRTGSRKEVGHQELQYDKEPMMEEPKVPGTFSSEGGARALER
jgi:hypothetical protein